MSDYVVSARKYRPDSFESLIGQDVIARTLKNSIARGQIAHAYLFCGPRGVGKTSTARIFAKAINCAHPTADFEPCGECESCVSFREGRSFCIHELDAASNNGVDDIKALLEQVQIPPQVGRYSVYIIDEVHMLSTSAFNAFLKTLEEPPAHAIFILATTEKHKIIPTILSRCQTYDFNRISVPDIVMNLRGIAQKEGIKIDDEALHIIAKKADGAMRDALTIFDQTVAFCGTDIKYEDVMRNLNVLDYEYTFKLVDAFIAGDYPTALLTFDEILAKGFNALHFVLALSAHFRDLLVSKTAGLEALLDLPASLKERYRAQAQQCPLKFLYDALGITTQCEAGYKASVNPRLHIEFALMKLCFLRGIPADVPAVSGRTGTEVTDAGKNPSGNASVTSAPARPVETPKPAETPAPADEPLDIVSLDDVLEVEPAPQPAPAEVAPAPQPAPRSRRRAAVNTGLSLADIAKAESGQASADSDAAGAQPVPEDEAILAQWTELVKQNASRPRLANALANAKLAVEAQEEDKVLVFTVTNEAQKKWIAENLLRKLEGSFQQLLGSNKVRLRVEAAEFVEEEKIYLPSEQAKDLMSKNEEVKNLVIDLGLDV
jgi:DNA polymerase-3 subunit gamma/tau